MDNSPINGRAESEDELAASRGVDLERIRAAKKRRIVQLKRWAHYDKAKEKEETSRLRKGLSVGQRRGGRAVRFSQDLILLEAGNSGDADEVRRLLSEGVCADVANGDGLTALHQCAINNNIDICRILIHFKANVNAKDKELWTPLHAAAICGHWEICQLLISNGADLLVLNTDGNMPYDICEDEITLDIIENEMAGRGITQDQINVTRSLPEQHMLSDLKAAVGRLGQSGAVQLFSILDKQGANQLHIAAACGYSDVVRFLISIEMAIDSYDKDGWQAIHVAALHNHLEVIQILVSKGANIDSQTKQGETVYELVFDSEMYDSLLLLKMEVDKIKENPNVTSSVGLVRRRSSTNPRTSSVRRSSMKEKSFLSWKEARQEAEIRRSLERKNPSENNISAANHAQEASDNYASNNNSRDSFVNSSLKGKHFIVNESIAEIDYNENEHSSTDPDQIEVSFRDSSNGWALPGLAKKNDKANFTHSHPYNSPTRDPNTFPYNPKQVAVKPTRDSVLKPVEPVIRPREQAPRESVVKTVDQSKQRQSSEKIPSNRKINTLPHTYHDPDEVVDAKSVSLRSGGTKTPQSKSPSISHKQIPASRSSVNSVKTVSSSHTTPISSQRSSHMSDHRKSNRQSIKATIGDSRTSGKRSAKPDSCCLLM